MPALIALREGWRRVSGRSWLLPSVVLPSIACLCMWAAWSVFRIGPNEWDDAMYCELAGNGRIAHETRNRYVHIWGLRLFFEMFDSRRVAAINYAASIAALMSIGAFFLGRRMNGTAGGLLAAAAVIFSPPILRYISVPHVDPSMVAWSMLAVAATVASCEIPGRRGSFVAAAGAGLTAYFAAKAKETGLCVVPVVLYFIAARGDHRFARLGSLGSGVIAGWLVHMGLDALFAHRGAGFWPSDWSTYLADKPYGGGRSKGTPKYEMNREYFRLLTRPDYWAFSIAGMIGAATGFHKSLAVRATTMWMLSGLTFTVLLSWYDYRLEANHRYAIVVVVPLAVLAASWWASILQRPRGHEFDALWVVPVIGLLAWICIGAMAAVQSGKPEPHDHGALYFVLPALLSLLALAPSLSRGRFMPLAAATLLMGIGGFQSYRQADAYTRERQVVLSPWLRLVYQLDHRDRRLVAWKPGRFAQKTVERRVRVLSSQPMDKVYVRRIYDPKAARKSEWIFVSGRHSPELEAQGWKRIIVGAEQHPWSVYRRR